MQALNLENDSTVKWLIKITNATRSHHHLMEWNFQKPTRALKGLFERFNIMAFKPKIASPWTILMAMDPLMILTGDPWFLNSLIGQKGMTAYTIKNWLKFSPNIVTYYKEADMPPKRKRIYKKYKNLAHIAYTKANSMTESVKQIDFQIMEEIYNKVNQNVITKNEATEYLLQTYHWSKQQVHKFIGKYDDFERYKKILHYKKGMKFINPSENNDNPS